MSVETMGRGQWTGAEMSKCAVLFPERDAVSPVDVDGCILQRGHLGPHRFVIGSQHYEWEADMECDCDDCMTDEVDSWCIVYWRAP